MYTYEIENNQIKIYDLSGTLKINQKTYPNGDSFDTHEEAEEWAQAFIASVTGASSFGAKPGKNIDPIPMPTQEEMLERRQQYFSNIDN